MLDFNPTKINCTGCTACYSICPKECINMKKDKEGFLYPDLNASECIHCGLCEKVCPLIRPISSNNKYKQRYFAAISKNIDVWRKSASGGAFTEICRAWGDSETYVGGAAWNGLSVSHRLIRGIDNIAVLRKSKYIESSLVNIYKEIATKLKRENKIIFCGTPCQVKGLKSFLRKDYHNLLTIDLICHGVGSPNVFQKCIEKYQTDNHCTVNNYEFRAKRSKYETDHLSCIKSDVSTRYILNDRYSQLFLNQLCLRPSCSNNCKFRSADRQGDITIADFKGLDKVFPELGGELYNYSSIIINSQKGEELLSLLSKSMVLHECDKSDIIKYNPLFAGHTWTNSDREIFFDDFIKSPSEAINKWTLPETDFKQSWKRKVFRLFPKNIRISISSIYAKILHK